MKFPFARFRLVLTFVGTVLFVFGLLLTVPLAMALTTADESGMDVRPVTFVLPIVVSLVLGAVCRWQLQRWKGPRPMGAAEASLICVLGWLAVSAVGALPFSLELGVSYLDAYFEAMSGFTTTGITMLSGLDGMPKSLLFWRAMTQWIGGLGILTFFMAVLFQGGMAHRLFGAESHKIAGRRVAHGMWNTLKILWLVYILLTAIVIGGLYLCGLGIYDAVAHGFTCLATGGYSPYDASIDYYEQAGYAHYAAIQYVLIFGMWAGGTSFLVHYRLIRGKLSALWDSAEVRLWWLILAGSVLLVMGSRLYLIHLGAGPLHRTADGWYARPDSLEATFRHSVFQVVSIASSTGFATRDIASDYFGPLARQVFTLLMLVGGCVGSTAGGLKVVRIVILWKLMARQISRALKPRSSVEVVMMDGARVGDGELHRTAALLFAWLVLLLFGALTTAALSSHGAMESASGMFSALGNIGPCYIPMAEMAQLHPVTKLVYIAGMLAGRLEIIPVLMLFSSRAWK